MKGYLKLLLVSSFLFAACDDDNEEAPLRQMENASPYITQVFDYRPGVGQFVNELPKYEPGDTQEDMNRKVYDAIGDNRRGMITLGGYGGYVVLGFDHSILNISGKRDFRVLGNYFENSAEPGIVMVSRDVNGNGLPDDEWYELAGSAHHEPLQEEWLKQAEEAGNDMNLYRNYKMTYHRPAVESEEAREKYIAWEDNQNHKGFKAKNQFHLQSYYPLWIAEDELTFEGTCLPQNGFDTSGQGSFFVLKSFGYGYADNAQNADVGSTFDIDWAVNANGVKVNLAGIDFIKIYTGVNQDNGWLGESSTEVMGVEDLHLLHEL